MLAPAPTRSTPQKELELHCPPLPQTLTEALHMIANPEQLETRQVVELVQRDPFVVARLLHSVNSAYYGLRNKVTTAERAVVMLGPVAVAGMVVGMAMSRLQPSFSDRTRPLITGIIRHSVAAAFMARHLSEGSQQPDPLGRSKSHRTGVAFTAGLLHDFGKMLLVYNFPDHALRFYAAGPPAQDLGPQVQERAAFGVDHVRAGEFAAQKLRFPAEIEQVIRHHHAVESAPADAAALVDAVHAANLSAKAVGHPFDRVRTWDECRQDPVWDRIAVRNDRSVEALLQELQFMKEHIDAHVRDLTNPSAPAAASARRW